MKNISASKQKSDDQYKRDGFFGFDNTIFPAKTHQISSKPQTVSEIRERPEILFVTSYPPRECGIATYSQDLIKAINNKFSNSLSIKVCALESGNSEFKYPSEVKYILNTSLYDSYGDLALKINNDDRIRMILIQHEFGFFKTQENAFLKFLNILAKPVIIVFHTVLPDPDNQLKTKIKNIAERCDSIIVMTHSSGRILVRDYGLSKRKISVIAHGTHLVPHLNKSLLKKKYGITGRKILTTFGLLSSGKSIETTINALPAIVKSNPEVLFLIIGKTHPEVLKEEGEKYRNKIMEMIASNKLSHNVKFINRYLPLAELLEYLQLTDIYLFTSNDPNQAVSGTFAYAMSCGCPIISTPIPHAKEVLTSDTGIIIDFRSSQQLAEGVFRLLNDPALRRKIVTNTLQKIVSTAWENSAVEHIMLIEKMASDKITIQYNLPAINLDHIKQMTTETGMIQFSKLNQPDFCSGYTLDDNARALIAMSMHYELTGNKESLWYIKKYLSFIKTCQRPDGSFLNYMDIENKFTAQNKAENLEDSNGRALWALGYLIYERENIPEKNSTEALKIFENAFQHILTIHSTRAMAFAIKGLYYYHKEIKSAESLNLLKTLAKRLVQMYRHESDKNWEWFEGYLTYANSVLPEALLCAWILTGETIYKEIALSSFNFLLSKTFNDNGIEVISNKNWLHRGQEAGHFGEQPIDVGYTIMALSKFYDSFGYEDYKTKMEIAFNWFLGNNRLHQIIYNPCTGGCYDGVEETHVNLNQGAESSISYLMARLTIDKYKKPDWKDESKSHVLTEEKSSQTMVMAFSGMDNKSKMSAYKITSEIPGIVKKKRLS